MSQDGARIKLARPGELRLATDPVCGMRVDPRAPPGGSFEHAGTRYFFCGPRCRERFAADPEHWLAKGPSAAAMAAPAAPTPGAPAPDASAVDLPDGPGGGRDAARRVPHLRHGARAEGDLRGPAGQPGARGHAPAPRGFGGAHAAARARRDGDDAAAVPRRPARPALAAARPGLARARARHAGGRLGRPAVLRAHAGQRPQREAQYVHPDRPRHWRRLPLQPRGGRSAGAVSGVAAHPRRGSGSLLRVGGRDRHARAAGPGARARGAPAYG